MIAKRFTQTADQGDAGGMVSGPGPSSGCEITERVELGAMWTTRGELVNIGGWPEAVAAKPTLRFGQAGGLLFGS